jgi:hypothetical protein
VGRIGAAVGGLACTAGTARALDTAGLDPEATGCLVAADVRAAFAGVVLLVAIVVDDLLPEGIDFLAVVVAATPDSRTVGLLVGAGADGIRAVDLAGSRAEVAAGFDIAEGLVAVEGPASGPAVSSTALEPVVAVLAAVGRLAVLDVVALVALTTGLEETLLAVGLTSLGFASFSFPFAVAGVLVALVLGCGSGSDTLKTLSISLAKPSSFTAASGFRLFETAVRVVRAGLLVAASSGLAADRVDALVGMRCGFVDMYRPEWRLAKKKSRLNASAVGMTWYNKIVPGVADKAGRGH